jgi:translation initiation factor 1 (eIF-1/SUI1)
MIFKLPSPAESTRIRPVVERLAAQRRRRSMTDSTENEMNKLLATLALCLACTGAFAQTTTEPMGGNPQRMAQMAQQLQSRFAAANTTQDGKLTRQQAAAGMPMVARYFDQIDTARAGYVTLPQIEAFMQQRATAH